MTISAISLPLYTPDVVNVSVCQTEPSPRPDRLPLDLGQERAGPESGYAFRLIPPIPSPCSRYVPRGRIPEHQRVDIPVEHLTTVQTPSERDRPPRTDTPPSAPAPRFRVSTSRHGDHVSHGHGPRTASEIEEMAREPSGAFSGRYGPLRGSESYPAVSPRTPQPVAVALLAMRARAPRRAEPIRTGSV